MEVLLQVSEAAHRLMLTPAGVRDLVRRGQLRVAVITGHGQRLFDTGDVDALARARAAARKATGK